MTIALLLTGFIRDINYINNISTFYNNNIYNKFNKLHIYYSCPSKLEEFDEFEFNKEYILSLFKNLNINNIEFFINFRSYDKTTFIEKSPYSYLQDKLNIMASLKLLYLIIYYHHIIYKNIVYML